MTSVEIERPVDQVAAIRLNRPERLNAIDFGLVADLHDALDAVAADDECKVVMLTGNGRGFCAGLDLKDYGALPAPGGHRHYPAGQTGQNFLASLTEHIRATPQVVLAVVNGPAFGGGLSLALACDLRIAGRSASFCSAFIRTGLTGTDAGVSYLLPRPIGAARAFDMILTGRTVDAAEAERMGIVSRVTDDDVLWEEAMDIATTVAGYTTFASGTPRKCSGTTSTRRAWAPPSCWRTATRTWRPGSPRCGPTWRSMQHAGATQPDPTRRADRQSAGPWRCTSTGTEECVSKISEPTMASVSRGRSLQRTRRAPSETRSTRR